MPTFGLFALTVRIRLVFLLYSHSDVGSRNGGTLYLENFKINHFNTFYTSTIKFVFLLSNSQRTNIKTRLQF